LSSAAISFAPAVPPTSSFAYEIGVILATLGQRDDAFRWFTRAVEERSGWIAYSRVDPRLETLHADPRFDALFSPTR
jgi:hypothetical protein